MSRRAAYHRGYYWANLESRRKTARDSRKRRRLIKALCEGIDEAQKRQAPERGQRGLDAAQIGPYA